MLAKPAEFFDHVRAADLLGPKLDQTEVIGLNAILGACEKWPLAWVAYALGTTYHETKAKMLPIKEIGGDSYFRRMYDKDGLRPKVAADLGNTEPGDGAKFAGRGYVQITGRKNYTKADAKLNLDGDLIKNPDLATRTDVAARIMRFGMEEGWFTGKRLSTYLDGKTPGTIKAFTEARRIINGTDRADDIAHYAAHFRDGLVKGEWT